MCRMRTAERALLSVRREGWGCRRNRTNVGTSMQVARIRKASTDTLMSGMTANASERMRYRVPRSGGYDVLVVGHGVEPAPSVPQQALRFPIADISSALLFLVPRLSPVADSPYTLSLTYSSETIEQCSEDMQAPSVPSTTRTAWARLVQHGVSACTSCDLPVYTALCQ